MFSLVMNKSVHYQKNIRLYFLLWKDSFHLSFGAIPVSVYVDISFTIFLHNNTAFLDSSRYFNAIVSSVALSML